MDGYDLFLPGAYSVAIFIAGPLIELPLIQKSL
jgi:hypothetical protein